MLRFRAWFFFAFVSGICRIVERMLDSNWSLCSPFSLRLSSASDDMNFIDLVQDLLCIFPQLTMTLM